LICPHCNAETSDMMNICELCGQTLPGTTERMVDRPSPGDATTGVYRPPDERSPSEQPPSGGDRVRRGGGAGSRWYLSPWPYLIGIAIIAAVVASLLLLRPSAKAYPELVVNNQPTLLDFYSDT